MRAVRKLSLRGSHEPLGLRFQPRELRLAPQGSAHLLCFSELHDMRSTHQHGLLTHGCRDAQGLLRLLCSDLLRVLINLSLHKVVFEVFRNKPFNLFVVDLHLAHSKKNFKWQMVYHFLFQ